MGPCFSISVSLFIYLCHSMILPLLGLCGRVGDFHFFIRHSLTRGNSLVPHLIPLQRTRSAIFQEAGLSYPSSSRSWFFQAEITFALCRPVKPGSVGPPSVLPPNRLTHLPLHRHGTVSGPHMPGNFATYLMNKPQKCVRVSLATRLLPLFCGPTHRSHAEGF